MRTFELHRDEDASGTSGTGVVAQGVEFDDRTVALRWLTECRSSAIFTSVSDVEKIHGHGGKTRIIYTGDPFRRGMIDCLQDRCENAPFNCVGGIGQRAELMRPKWIAPSEWEAYRDGYERAAREQFGDDWRTCEFGWGPALTIPGGAAAPEESSP